MALNCNNFRNWNLKHIETLPDLHDRLNIFNTYNYISLYANNRMINYTFQYRDRNIRIVCTSQRYKVIVTMSKYFPNNFWHFNFPIVEIDDIFQVDDIAMSRLVILSLQPCNICILQCNINTRFNSLVNYIYIRIFVCKPYLDIIITTW